MQRTAANTNRSDQAPSQNSCPNDDASWLAARLAGVNKARFGRLAGVSPSMIAHHLAGRRPINLNDALRYAKAFGVALDEVSPSHAQLVVEAYPLTRHHLSAQRLNQKPAATPPVVS